MEKNSIGRKVKWFFVKSGIILLAAEHFLAMLPATLLFPIAVNKAVGEDVIDMSLVLFTSGLGTLIFIFVSFAFKMKTKKQEQCLKKRIRIPAYLGSSFAYISLTIYLLDAYEKEGVPFAEAYEYVGWSYIFSGVLLMLLSLIYKYNRIEKLFSALFPPTVIGPAISLIGLGLADNAVVDAGVDIKNNEVNLKAIVVAVCTLIVIILFSLLKIKFLKNASIITGMIIGYIIYVSIYGKLEIDFSKLEGITVPSFNLIFPLRFPPDWPRLLVSVIPSTLIVFMENMGRVTVINRMLYEEDNKSNLYDKKMLGRALLSHGFASVVGTVLGSVPNTMYAENIAVMGIHRYKEPRKEDDRFIKSIMDPFSLWPYCLAAIAAIILSFSGVVQTFLFNIPTPIIGGMELFLFGVISAPGIQLLVEQRVNYKKTSNQIITAVVLITGISDFSIEFKWFELKGMSLGLVAGLIVNIIVLLFERRGWLSDDLFIDEVLSSCIVHIPENANLTVQVYQSTNKVFSIPVSIMKNVLFDSVDQVELEGERLSAEFLRDIILHSTEICINSDTPIIKINKDVNTVFVYINKNIIPQNYINEYVNDYQEAVHINKLRIENNSREVEFLTINLSRKISIKKIEKLIKKIYV